MWRNGIQAEFCSRTEPDITARGWDIEDRSLTRADVLGWSTVADASEAVRLPCATRATCWTPKRHRRTLISCVTEACAEYIASIKDCGAHKPDVPCRHNRSDGSNSDLDDGADSPSATIEKQGRASSESSTSANTCLDQYPAQLVRQCRLVQYATTRHRLDPCPRRVVGRSSQEYDCDRRTSGDRMRASATSTSTSPRFAPRKASSICSLPSIAPQSSPSPSCMRPPLFKPR